MNLAQKDILKLTLMAFDNNSANIRDLRQDSKNKFSIREMDSLLKIEQKMDEVKSVIMRVLIDAEEIAGHLFRQHAPKMILIRKILQLAEANVPGEAR